MASSGKKKTTMAKMNRENKMRERRAEKQAKKDRRKQAAIDNPGGVTEPDMGDAVTGDAVTGDALTSDALDRDAAEPA
ncbi:MAG: hypothetical protein JWQ20_2426 [Conexibacter sp.]|nr:hypothetical protein [Conexibacter sp.]